MSSQLHQSDTTVLDRRTLHRDHRVLADLLRPGMAVLDVGCGTGAITRGVAEAVGASGSVVGVDRDRDLIVRARTTHSGVSNLRFVNADVADLTFAGEFDIVSAARTLQWVADIEPAVKAMARAAKAGGLLVVLDYNHALNEWEPRPPAAFAEFYRRFLAWREANGWDNAIANRCPVMLEAWGLDEVRAVSQDQTIVRGDPQFEEAAALWLTVIDNLGATMVSADACDAALLEAARREYDDWRMSDLQRQTLSMKASVGRVPAASAS